jgi:tetratricopeptide (TPR) repeat protein
MSDLKHAWKAQDISLVAEKAYLLLQQGRYLEAEVLLEGLLAIDSQNRYCRLALATVCVVQGDLRKAVEQFDLLITFHPNDVEGRVRRCEAYLRLNWLQAAEEDLRWLKRVSGGAEVQRLQFLMDTQPVKLLQE